MHSLETSDTHFDDSFRGDEEDAANGELLSSARWATRGLAKVENEDSMTAEMVERITVAQRIVSRRGAFRWLPVFFCNDVVHGSWWFVLGSFLAMLTAVVPLIQSFYPIFHTTPGTLPILDFYATWLLLIISGFFYTVGSYAFVRAFAEPPMEHLFKWYHFGTDELFGSWMFLLGTMPGIPYTFIYWSLDPANVVYMGMVLVAVLCIIGCYMFVLGCYPAKDKQYKQMLKPVLRVIFGRNHWILMHLQNDWLAGTWFFFYATLICLLGSFGIFWQSLHENNELEQFIYGLGFVDFFLFLIGCMYFVAGSYPLDMLKCYRSARSRSDSSGAAGGGHSTSQPKRTGIQKFIRDAEKYLHPNDSHYQSTNTDNLGDAENPLHQAHG